MHTKADFDIVVVGSNMVDLLSKIPRLPKIGETLRGTSFHLGFGGKGANQAVMAARLGAKVAMVTRVGDDIFGPMTIENLNKQGIDTENVSISSGMSSGVAPILVDEQGQNMIIIIPGANTKLSKQDVRKAEPQIQRAKIVISQLEISDDAIEEAFKIAREAHVMTILNPAPARPVSFAIINSTDLIVPNESEAELLTGIAVTGKNGAEEAARCLIKLGAKRVVLTLGAEGAMLMEEGKVNYFPAVPVKAVDSTGAGDAFIGSLAYALSRGDDLSSAIVFANRCAALSVTKIGTQISFPTPAEVGHFLDLINKA